MVDKVAADVATLARLALFVTDFLFLICAGGLSSSGSGLSGTAMLTCASDFDNSRLRPATSVFKPLRGIRPQARRRCSTMMELRHRITVALTGRAALIPTQRLRDSRWQLIGRGAIYCAVAIWCIDGIYLEMVPR